MLSPTTSRRHEIAQSLPPSTDTKSSKEPSPAAKRTQSDVLAEPFATHAHPRETAATTVPTIGRPVASHHAEEAAMLEKIPSESWMSPSLVLTRHEDKGGSAIIATQPIPRDALLTIWGGKLYKREAFFGLSEHERTHGLQITEGLYLLSNDRADPTDFFNHSCDPNAVLEGLNRLVARRDIRAGEEVCFDYATTDGSPYDQFECRCGTSECRGQVTGDDWKRKDVQEKYSDQFLPYLRRRIEALDAAEGKR